MNDESVYPCHLYSDAGYSRVLHMCVCFLCVCVCVSITHQTHVNKGSYGPLCPCVYVLVSVVHVGVYAFVCDVRVNSECYETIKSMSKYGIQRASYVLCGAC